jgi:enamine deaminase RidA (YjgF/YER057c/UK114 family)
MASGAVLAVAGQIGWNTDGELTSDDLAAQFDVALENVVRVVRAAGAGPSDIIRLTLYVTDRMEYKAKLKQVGEAYRRHMGRHYPAMALVQVAALLEDGAKVEIEATAVVPA